MGLKAWFQDENNTIHLLIGLNRENVELLQRGDVLTLPPGEALPLSDDSDIILTYEDTDEKLVERMKAHICRHQRRILRNVRAIVAASKAMPGIGERISLEYPIVIPN